MSLTSALADPNGNVSRFILGLGADVTRARQDFDSTVAVARRVLPPKGEGTPAWATVGRAFGYRVGFAVDNVPPYAAMLGAVNACDQANLGLSEGQIRDNAALAFWRARGQAPIKAPGLVRAFGDGRWLCADGYEDVPPQGVRPPATGVGSAFINICERTATFCASNGVVGGTLTAGAERVLARVGWIFSEFEQLYRDPRRFLDSDLITQGRNLTADDLLAMASDDDRSIKDIVAISQRFTEQGLPLLMALGSLPGTVNPVFVDDWADADVLIGDCLIDVKTVARNEFDDEWIYQLLGYALLDVDDIYRIRRVGLYFSRHGRLLTWPLQDLVPRHCSRGELLPAVREAFLSALEFGPISQARGFHLGKPEFVR